MGLKSGGALPWVKSIKDLARHYSFMIVYDLYFIFSFLDIALIDKYIHESPIPESKIWVDLGKHS